MLARNDIVVSKTLDVDNWKVKEDVGHEDLRVLDLNQCIFNVS